MEQIRQKLENLGVSSPDPPQTSSLVYQNLGGESKSRKQSRTSVQGPLVSSQNQRSMSTLNQGPAAAGFGPQGHARQQSGQKTALNVGGSTVEQHQRQRSSNQTTGSSSNNSQKQH